LKHSLSFQTKLDFFQLLHDTSGISRQSYWPDVRLRLEYDPRYRAVDSNARREDWFREYCQSLNYVVRQPSFSSLHKIANMHLLFFKRYSCIKLT